MGLDVIQGDHEDAPGQLELNWMFDDVLRNADRLTTYRQICAQVAREFDIIRLLHDQAVHGRVGVGLPPQHVACGAAVKTKSSLAADRERSGQIARHGRKTTCT